MAKYFGTDGIRGIANVELTAQLAFKTGMAISKILTETTEHKPKIFIGKDTRISSDMIEKSLVSGICSGGCDVVLLGFMPTPAVPHLSIKYNGAAAIVISASHNSFEYNGIKIFGSNGYKLSDEMEAKLEEYIDADLKLKTHGDIGRILTLDINPIEEYTDFLASSIAGDLSNIKIAVDCANGAASSTAESLFKKVGANVKIINDTPNGTNINDNCGSTHLKGLSELVTSGSYDIGIAFDGDADRCLIVDENGNLFDGDRIMAFLATSLKAQNKLKGDTFVATILSNMGLHAYAKTQGIKIECADVGDRYVLEMMLAGGYNLGGEQSGHLIYLDFSTTGDGQLTAIKFLEALKMSGKSVSEIGEVIKPFPQIMINTPVSNDKKHSIAGQKDVLEAIKTAEGKLGGGRILVRPSGTEALVRVMAEGESADMVNLVCMEISEIIKKI